MNSTEIIKLIKQEAMYTFTSILKELGLLPKSMSLDNVLISKSTVRVYEIVETPCYVGELKITFPINNVSHESAYIDLSHNGFVINKNNSKIYEYSNNYSVENIKQIKNILWNSIITKEGIPNVIKILKEQLTMFFSFSEYVNIRYIESLDTCLLGDLYVSKAFTVVPFEYDGNTDTICFEFSTLSPYIMDLVVPRDNLNLYLDEIEEFFKEKNDYTNTQLITYSLKDMIPLFKWINSCEEIEISKYYSLENTKQAFTEITFNFQYHPKVHMEVSLSPFKELLVIETLFRNSETIKIDSPTSLLLYLQTKYTEIKLLDKSLSTL